jgi:hypothetical protein
MARINSLVAIGISDADYRRVNSLLRQGPRVTDQALRGAVNRTIGTGRTLVKKAIKGKLNVTDKDIDRAIGRRLAVAPSLTGEINITRYNLPLRAFKPTQTKRGVKVRILKDGPTKIFRHLFIRDLPRPDETGSPAQGQQKQTTQVVGRGRSLPSKGPNAGGKRTQWVTPRRRKDKSGKWQYGPFKRYRTTTRIKLTPDGRAGSFRLDKNYGPSVLTIFGATGASQLAREALRDIGTTLQKNINNQISYFLSGRRNLTEQQRAAG